MVRNRITGATVSGFFCFVLWLSAGPVRSQDEDYFRIRAERLSCIVEYSDRYLSGEDVVAIIVEDCGPNAEPADLLSIWTNEVPPVPDLDDGPDRYIVLTPDDFECLERQSIPDEVEYVRYYPSECRVEPE